MEKQLNYINNINVFTDGSCMRKKNDKGEIILKCGYGIYYHNNELQNISRPFINDPPTNNRAELQAIYVCLLQIKEKYTFELVNKITIYSDSQYCIKSLTEYIKKWEQNDWKTANKKSVENQDIIKPINTILKKYNNKIVFIHVKAHTGKQDFMSLANNIVDNLAKQGAEKSIPYIVNE